MVFASRMLLGADYKSSRILLAEILKSERMRINTSYPAHPLTKKWNDNSITPWVNVL